MDFLSEWLQRGNYLPHGYCFTWTPGLLWSMVGADAVTAAAYYSIPVALVSFVRRRPDMSFSWVLWLFSAFIFACGTTHLMSIWTIWQPDYGLEAMVKLFTAAISIVTAVLLWPLIPKALKIPSVQALQAVVASLEAEVQQRRSVEQSLADVQESLAITLASIGAGFITTDRAGRITRMNPVAEQLTGWPVSEALGRDFWDVWVREGAPESHRNRNTVDLLLADSALQASARRVVVVSRQGQRTSVEMKASLTFDSNGAARGMAMVLRDLSGVERAEVQANQLAAIVESSDDAIVGKTLQGQIISWNRGAQALFGYAADEIIGQPVATLIPPERMPEETALLARLAEGERIAPFDTQRRRKDGTLVDVSITVSPVRDAQGRIVAASKIARDISARHRHEALRLTAIRLEAENRQVQEANRLKSDFLANMSHELRTPLNAIIGFAELLHAGALPAESPKYRDFLGHIGTSGRHLLQLINDLLDLSKVESGKFEFFPEPIDLPRVVAEVVDILHGTAARGSLTLTTEIDPALTGLVLDPARLKQVLYNYLSNAIKFTPPGGRVSLRATTHGDDAWRIEVEDTGIGIAADDLNRLFAVFQQLDSGYTKRHAGTGLGLALTRRLAEEQGGSVGVRSEPGRGSVFHVTLPRVVPGAQRRVIDRAPLPPLAGNALRVLVIEDEPQDQARIVAALEHAGLQAVPASTAAQALGHAAGESFAAITLDLLLPDGSGLEVLAAIRNEGPNRETPVIVVTMVTDHNAVAGFAVADVLGKPIRPDEVVAALRKCDLVRQPRARVLVIDDERASLDLMAATLEQAGIDALCRQDARQALEELDTLRPDAIILDLMMPGFDGFATLDALRALPAWAATPVFVWTSLQLSQAEYERLAQSAQAILHKGQSSLAQMVERLRVHAPVRQMTR